ncbi:hypothetical protein IJH89_01995 [Candidatus Saccharibacteria bacterium]|nr:hypothetical protein [Candidatus Saccharibacteria bacterium]
MTFKDNLKTYRTLNHFSQERLAEKLLEKETLEEKDLASLLKPASLPASAKLH